MKLAPTLLRLCGLLAAVTTVIYSCTYHDLLFVFLDLWWVFDEVFDKEEMVGLSSEWDGIVADNVADKGES